MRACRHFALLAALVAAVGLPGCGDDPAPQPREHEAVVVRARAAALFADEKFAEAKDVLAPLLAVEQPAGVDLLSGGILALELGDRPGSVALVERALAASPQDPAVHFVYARLLEQAGRMEEATRHLRLALAGAPDDQPTRLALAWRLLEGDQVEEAEALYREFLGRGVAHTGSWHLTGLYQLATLLYRTGRSEEAESLFAQKVRLEDQGLSVPSSDDSQRGTFGRIRSPSPVAPRSIAVGDLKPGTTGKRAAPLEGTIYLFAATQKDEWVHLDTGGCRVGRSDLLAYGPAGVWRLPADGSAAGRITDVPAEVLLALDLENDRDLDLLIFGPQGARLLRLDDGVHGPAGFDLPALQGDVRAAHAVDYDHDGDLDVALVGEFGLRLWRNDGIGVEGGRFTDATSEAVPQSFAALLWIQTEDFDTDQDVDLLVGSAETLFLLSNLRAGRFEVVEVQDVPPSARRYLAADFNADGRPDLLSVEQGRLYLGRLGTGAFEAGPTRPGVGTTLRARATDSDADGRWDVLWLDRTGVGVLQAAGFDAGKTARFPAAEVIDALSVDVDGSPAPEVVTLAAGGMAWTQTGPQGQGFRLALRGIKDNARGVGAVVEVRAGALYQRLYWRGEPRWIGLGKASKADVVRITWPNGVVQHDLDVAAGCERLIEQAEGLVGSCPFLYSWNGKTFEFITDVLGITPMGLPMAPGMLVPPDHDEYVRIRGEQLQPRTLDDGSSVYEVQLTEELREVTYFDRARLVVVDHPEATEMEPNERFTFPPFPEHRIHVMADVREPVKVSGSDGRDWTGELRAIDGEYAAPFTAYRGQWLGLANPHFLELSFDGKDLDATAELRLVCTGWFYWTDASVNMATARTPGVDFIPPILQVPDPERGPDAWRDVGPPVGFPAGKTKTMILDVSSILNRQDPRIRIFSSLRLYWDSIRLCVGPDAPARLTELEPTSAWLWERGFSKPIFLAGEHRLEWFDWDQLDQPRWNQHPGMYTRFGEVLPLLTSTDDCFVIMGSGDALRVRFDASKAPALEPGWRRDFLLYLDGWAKDRDPNTLEALHVEPLPFHGMKGYPYPPDQRYPDTVWSGTRAPADAGSSRSVRSLSKCLLTFPPRRPGAARPGGREGGGRPSGRRDVSGGLLRLRTGYFWRVSSRSMAGTGNVVRSPSGQMTTSASTWVALPRPKVRGSGICER